jgi:hypothetical protein
MPDTTIMIGREQRQPLQRLVMQHISGIGDVNLMIEQKDFASAERYGLEYGEDLRMLDDLGWDPDDARASYALTLPADELIEALKRLRLDAEGGLNPAEDERCKRSEYDELAEYFTRARDLCTELIETLDPRVNVAEVAAPHRDPTLKINRAERDSLHDLMIYRFFSEQATWRAREHGVGDAQLARELEAEMWLMGELGWVDRELGQALGTPDADRPVFGLTMPVGALHSTLNRILEDARAGFTYVLRRTPTETPAQRRVRFRVAVRTCEELLARLENQREEPA